MRVLLSTISWNGAGMKAVIVMWLLWLALYPAHGFPITGDYAGQITKNDLADIQDLVQKATTPRTEIWLLAAEDTFFEVNTRRVIRLTVYLTPKLTSPRVRRGDYLCLYNGELSPERGARKVGRWTYDPKEQVLHGGSYACVARLPYRFLNHDGKVGDPLGGPVEYQLSTPPTDQELMAMNDALRSFFVKQNDLGGDSNWAFVKSFIDAGSQTDGRYQVSDRRLDIQGHGSPVTRMIFWRLNYFTTLQIGLHPAKTGWFAESRGVSEW